MDQKQLRALVGRMQEGVERASRSAASDGDRRELSSAWSALQLHLAVEEAPALRVCPSCDREIMRDATMCGYCWTKSAAGGVHA